MKVKIDNLVFQDREEAFKMLYDILPTSDMIKEEWIILAISTGGVPIAIELSKKLLANFDYFFTEKYTQEKIMNVKLQLSLKQKRLLSMKSLWEHLIYN